MLRPILIILLIVRSTAALADDAVPTPQALAELKKHFEWITTIGAKELDADENERFIKRIANGAGRHFPDEALKYVRSHLSACLQS